MWHKEMFDIMRIFTFFLLVSMICVFYYTKRNSHIWNIQINIMDWIGLLRTNFDSDPTKYSKRLQQLLWSNMKLRSKEGIYLLWTTFVRSYYMMYRSKFFEPILKSKIHIRKGSVYKCFQPWLNNSLFLSSGDVFQSKKKMFLPLFKYHDELIAISNENANILADKIAASMKSEQFLNILPVVSACTLDITYEILLGMKLNAQGQHQLPYVQALNDTLDAIHDRNSRIWQWSDVIYFRTKAGKRMIRNLNVMTDFVEQALQRKLQEERSRIQFQPSVSDCEYQNYEESFVSSIYEKTFDFQKRRSWIHTVLPQIENGSLTLEDIAGDLQFLLFAGHDTTSQSISWTLYILGLHPEIQRKVHKELDSIFGDNVNKAITGKCIQNMKYLDCVIKETLRMFPPVECIGRTLEHDVEVDGYYLPQDSEAIMNIKMLHRDPDIFQDPDVFNPDRFKLSDHKRYPPFAYVPFSSGMRTCLGKRYAMLENHIVLATILHRFRVESMLPLDKIDTLSGIITKPINGLPLSFKPREIRRLETDIFN